MYQHLISPTNMYSCRFRESFMFYPIGPACPSPNASLKKVREGPRQARQLTPENQGMEAEEAL